MIYLDYSTTTPVSLDALNSYVKVSKDYPGSIYSNNKMGETHKEYLNNTTKELALALNILECEINYTSGATEANNMALIGFCLSHRKKGKHIIVSKLEHPSIYLICAHLENMGFEISYVKNDEDGLVIFDDLKKLIREDTILVSIGAVNNETGVRQPLKMLRQIIKKENPNTVFHSDLAGALGKTVINFKDIDLGSISSHKIYGPKGIGFLYKNKAIKLMPLSYGNNNNHEFKPGEVPLPLIVSMKDAIVKGVKDLEKKEKYVHLLNNLIVDKVSKLEGININKTKYSLPHILNISFKNISEVDLVEELSKEDIYISYNDAGISNGVMAIFNDTERSKRVVRISLSHLTTVAEVNEFLKVFEDLYNKLNS